MGVRHLREGAAEAGAVQPVSNPDGPRTHHNLNLASPPPNAHRQISPVGMSRFSRRSTSTAADLKMPPVGRAGTLGPRDAVFLGGGPSMRIGARPADSSALPPETTRSPGTRTSWMGDLIRHHSETVTQVKMLTSSVSRRRDWILAIQSASSGTHQRAAKKSPSGYATISHHENISTLNHSI